MENAFNINADKVAYMIYQNIVAYLWDTWKNGGETPACREERLNSLCEGMMLMCIGEVHFDSDNGMPYAFTLGGKKVKVDWDGERKKFEEAQKSRNK